MNESAYIPKPELHSLPQMQSRMTFLYLEHCKISRDAYSITITDDEGIIFLPAASICTVLLGPGTSISHQAVELIAEAGITIVWVGEEGVRFYAFGRAMTHSSSLLLKQAELVCNEKKHIKVARLMYQMRFPNEDVSKLSMQQLRGREGSRIRQVYRNSSKKWGIKWSGRSYKTYDYASGDDVNKALSSGHACLYGLAHAVIVAMGCSTGLGFVHVGHENSFVYDIADLYKAEITIPLAFEVAAGHPDDVGSEMRRRTRDAFVGGHILERMIKDIHTLLNTNEGEDEAIIEDEVLLWNGSKDLVKNGYNYAQFGEIEDYDCIDNL